MAAYNDEAFRTLMEIIEQPELADDPRFSSFARRTQLDNEKALQEALESWSTKHPVDEVIQRVQDVTSRKEGRAAAVVTGKVTRPADTMREQNWWDRGSFRKVRDPVYGEVALQGPVWKMTESPPRIKWPCRPVGADNTFIYSTYLGIGPTALEEMKSRGVL
jgi:crotonobetainyl-CoA:carnitine CoA-transferase CaiB-like acyl-CoA transferase